MCDSRAGGPIRPIRQTSVYRKCSVTSLNEPRPVSSRRRPRVGPSGLLIAFALASMMAAGTSPPTADGNLAPTGEAVVGAYGEMAPSKLPRSRTAPTTLRIGFTSETPGTNITPELTEIRFEVSRNIVLQPTGLPSCPIAALYSRSSDARKTCAGSLVGHGIVISEVTLPGQSPATVEGRLSAFYDLTGDQPRILAQVTGTGALPLTYVVPFTISKVRGIYGTVLSAEHMQHIAGICQRGHPGCFSQAYTYEGIYGHISKFELALDRKFSRRGKRISVVSADCPSPNGSSSATFPLMKVNLAYPYPHAILRSQVAAARCEVSTPRRRATHFGRAVQGRRAPPPAKPSEGRRARRAGPHRRGAALRGLPPLLPSGKLRSPEAPGQAGCRKRERRECGGYVSLTASAESLRS